MSHRYRRGIDQQLDLAAEQVGHRRPAALVWHHQQVDARLRLQQLGREVQKRTAAGDAGRNLAWIRLGVGDELPQ